ncbi:PREDICTED: odorant receptor 46a, isoform A-like [Papilio polytes]|uniref:odorant receptor 46a, isoform A-like n=1 Tax=Papilio polytes TaxID=76194 RepID=UPI00067681F3|nr:PREDICTED: odorant receptor 46a, isoform A-like [Papilio polytes]
MTTISKCFTNNVLAWKIFGIWSGPNPNKYYKYFSFIFVNLTLTIFNLFLTINLFYTYNNIENLLHEVIYFFTEITVVAKASMILFWKKEIMIAFDILDSDDFEGNDEKSIEIIEKDVSTYKKIFKFYFYFCNLSYILAIVPGFVDYLLGNDSEFPISKYNFLGDEIREQYFTLLYFYQSFCIYVHMVYNISVDSLITGFVFLIITQLKVLKYKFKRLNFKNRALKRRNASEGSTVNSLLFLLTYITAMVLIIFVPSWLGTQLMYESKDLVTAAYNSDWMNSSKEFKRSIIIFMERTKTPMCVVGMKMFLLSLDTFITIMKTAYSLYTLISRFRNVT